MLGVPRTAEVLLLSPKAAAGNLVAADADVRVDGQRRFFAGATLLRNRPAARQGDRNDLCRRLRWPPISDVRDLLEFLQGPQHR
ncbi:MAG: hypothetical protein QOI82_1465 [Actinomycetota bacterium]|nr:hypothetical protein [Actinomycetota bacterium]